MIRDCNCTQYYENKNENNSWEGCIYMTFFTEENAEEGKMKIKKYIVTLKHASCVQSRWVVITQTSHRSRIVRNALISLTL